MRKCSRFLEKSLFWSLSVAYNVNVAEIEIFVYDMINKVRCWLGLTHLMKNQDHLPLIITQATAVQPPLI